MKKRKIVMSVLIVTMLASCMACGNIKDHKDETLKNSVTEKVTVSDTEVAKDTENIDVATEEDTEKAIADGNTNIVTPETEKSVAENNKAKANDNAVASKPAEKPAKKPADNTGNSNAGKHENSGNSGNNSGNNGNHNDNTEKPHVHKYNSGVVTKEPTCTDTGIKTYTCVDNDYSYDEKIPALGHNPVQHTETVTTKEAWDEPVLEPRYICNGCGEQFKTVDEFCVHSILTRRENPNTTCKSYYSDAVQVNTIHHPAETETRTYKVCSRCGDTVK